MPTYISNLPFAKEKKKQSVLAIILPVFLLLSFVWLNFYTTMTDINSAVRFLNPLTSLEAYMFGNVLIKGVFDYLIFELLFFVYRFCLGFSIYSFMIPKDVLKNKFRFWYIIRNIVLGFVFNIRFFFPYFAIYSCIFEMAMNMLLVVCLYFDLNKQYVEPLVGQFVFKTLAFPVVVYEVFEIIILWWGVLWEK